MAALCLFIGASALAVVPSVASARADPYASGQGNPGYDVAHYDLWLRYHAGTDVLEGRTRLRARAVRDLRRFRLDLRLPASSVRVDGRPVRFAQDGGKLRVTPRPAIEDGERFVVDVSYRGRPGSLPARGADLWHDTRDGAWVSGFTGHASRWYAVNNRPSDKATYDLRIDAAPGRTVLSNGRLVARRVLEGRWQRTHWRMRRPMAPYLAFVAIGDFRVRSGRSRAGVPYRLAVSEHLPRPVRRRAFRALRATPRIVDHLSRVVGRYPFGSVGGVVVDAPRDYFYATEMQTFPLYSSSYFRVPVNQEELVAHEVAHQWFGDSLTVRRYRHLWLSEGFAVWASWLWEQHRGGLSVAERFEETFDATAATPRLWRDPVTRPDRLLGFATYTRGALTVHALRQRLGNGTFARVLRTWVREHRGGNVDTAQFVRHAQRVSGEDLRGFFRHWLRDPRPPARTAENGWPPGGG